MVKSISIFLFIFILCTDYFAQPNPFVYKISGNGDIISDAFLIQDGFVLDSATIDKRTYAFEYNKNGKLIRDINFLRFQIRDSITGRVKIIPGYKNYFYNERGNVDSVSAGIWNATRPEAVSSGYKISYTYDNEGNILSETNSSSGVVSRIEENSYDSSGNLILNKVILPQMEHTKIINREYDLQNRLIKTSTSESPFYRTDQILYQYDISGNVNCTTQSINIDSVISKGWNYYIEFDDSGKAVYQIQSRIFNPADSTWGESSEVLMKYDESGKIIKMGETLFRYNSEGNIDSLLILHVISSGYLGGKYRFVDSYGNEITVPEYAGIITFYYSSILTNIEVNNQKDLNFSLSQNYPNPFNPSTIIKYQIQKEDFVTIRIFNSIGQLVKNLVNEQKNSGEYSVLFDGKNNTGQPLSSGIYFYQLRVGEFVSSKKMILLK